MLFDFGCFTGHWPYRRLRRGSLENCRADLAAAGVGGGLMASLDAVFYNDSWEGDGPLLEALSGTGFSLAICLNPALPWWRLRLGEAARAGARAVRLYPGIHGYPLEAAEELCREAGELGLGVIVTARMEDQRLQYLLRQEPVSPREAAGLAKKCPGTQVILSNFYLSELEGLSGENLWADTAGLCHGLFPFENLEFPRERLLFASFAPLQCPESAVCNLPEEQDFLDCNTRNYWEACNGGTL